MAGTNAEALAKIDPGFDALMKSLPVPPLSFPGKIDWSALREQLAARKRALNAAQMPPAEGITIDEATVTARDGYEIPIRTYKPHKPREGGAPLVVFVHGGGFCIGDMDGEELNCRAFAQNLGCVAVNIEYRLAPDHPFPYGPLDCWDVLKWAAAHASELGADPSAGFIVGGTSAGGNISAVLGIKAIDEKLSPPLTGLALLIPAVTDYRVFPEQYKGELVSMDQNKDAPILPRSMVVSFMDAYQPELDSRLYNLLGTLGPEDYAKLPPTFFQVCGMDPLRDEALLYERLVREAGVKTKLEIYPGVPHAFWSMFPKWETSIKFVRDTAEGVEWLLQTDKQ